MSESLRTLIEFGSLSGMSDRQLLAWFLDDRKEPDRAPGAERAFAGLVARHGPMVLGVCRHLLADENDADDAFQAVFLVLAKRAAAIDPPELLGAWLHGVAAKICRKAMSQRTIRRNLEADDALLAEIPSPSPHPEHAARHREEARIVHEEVARLPERYRRAVVLCDFQGLTHTEAARAIGCPPGTVSAQLSRARQILHGKLIRRGLAPAVATAAISSSLQPRAALAAIPPALQQATISAALAFALGQGIAIPSVAASLARAVLGARRAVGLLSGTIALGAAAIAGAGMYAAERGAAPPRPAPITSAPPQPQPQAQAPQPVAPSLPQAVTSPPDWLGKDVPFDVNAFFAVPPDDNAAPLYLDAFFEFVPEVAICFPEGAERDRREEATRQRGRRFGQLYSKWGKNPKDVSAEDVDKILAELEPGFLKLAVAQERPRCVFQTNLGITKFPHAAGARATARVLDLRVARELERGELNRALNDIARSLRLSRDLRPRAGAIMMNVSLGGQSIAIRSMVLPILAHPSLTVSHCDRLLALLRSHEAESIDPYPESIKAEYLDSRALLHDLVHHQDRLRADLESEGGSTTPSLTAGLAEPRLITKDSPFKPRTLTERLAFAARRLRYATEQMMSLSNVPLLDEYMARMPDDTMAKLVSQINEYTREELSLGQLPYAERLKRMKIPTKLFAEADVYTRVARGLTVHFNGSVFPSARGIAQVRNAQGLACVRRWQLTHEGALPASLEEATRAAGIPESLIDPYIDEPVRLAVIDGQPVVYCVGADGKDDKARKDAWRPLYDGDELLAIPKR